MNNDRFKFRVWYPAAGRYCANFSLDTDGVVWSGHTTLREGFTIEFCTGLRDKNGRLIYEGDVIMDHNEACRIIWNDSRAEFVSDRLYLRKRYNLFALIEDQSYLYEIVGNIHEAKWKIEREVKE